jgi:hypothetical protein
MHRRRKRGERGFALLVIVLIVALLAATVTLALREATSGLAAAGGAKSAELVYADLQSNLKGAITTIAMTDPLTLIGAQETYDIFLTPPGSPITLNAPLAANSALPTGAAGSLYGIPVTVGLRPGQRTDPPPGEDVRTTYGYVVEVQLQADLDTTDARNGGAVPAQERVSVGVRIPQVQSHANN